MELFGRNLTERGVYFTWYELATEEFVVRGVGYFMERETGLKVRFEKRSEIK